MTQESTVEIQREYDWLKTSPSEAVIETIADYEEIDSTDVIDKTEGPLYRYIDTDALNAVVKSGNNLTLSFTYSDYGVHIGGDGIQIITL